MFLLWDIVVCCCFCILRQSCYASLLVLKLYTWLTLKLRWSSCISLPSAEVTDMALHLTQHRTFVVWVLFWMVRVEPLVSNANTTGELAFKILWGQKFHSLRIGVRKIRKSPLATALSAVWILWTSSHSWLASRTEVHFLTDSLHHSFKIEP